ncbi:5'-Nucleotidase domain protein [Alkaliphilus metalliredigens QYMF]|uniref:5'-Nucleotidase domain protein n=1 Tax=Alkaliphilus metalliredigens (strain QYMF) TaxID=293826 RepID=A6TU64_ALKMQ|nr:5'-nucleotidase C-terminal domain-containing protein [Alkaliphilus metalliredigens]ABR49732.1 5'-Nucleotidase domain protein [Alkaliphilus metalliredigens QYMF]
MLFKRKLFVCFLVVAMVFSTVGAIFAVENVGEETKIMILHTNDIHGRVVEDRFDGMGFDRIATLVNQFRSENEHVLLLDAGDTFHGMPIATLERGESIVRIMNEVEYDVMVAGNHEFNYGQERLLELDEMANFPVLSANIKKEDGSYLLTPYIIKELNGVKVGIFGLTSPETLFKSHPAGTVGLTFVNPVEAAKEMVEELQDEVDVIIALAHLGTDESTKYEERSSAVAEEVEGIHLIVDGHSHSLFEEGLLVGNTLIVSAEEYGKNLGVVEITMKDGQVDSITASVILKEEAMELEQDPTVKEVVDTIIEEQKLILSEVLGTTTVHLEGERETARAGETNLGNLITDAMQDATGADFVVTNGGGIRASIAEGKITRGDVITVLPFGNVVVTKEIKGSAVKEALEIGSKGYPEPSGAILHVAGMSYTIDPNQPEGERVIDIMIQGEPLDLERDYLMATNDFLAAGGDGYTMFVEALTITDYMSMDEAVMEYIQEKQVVAPQVEGRINGVALEIVEEPVIEEPVVEEPVVEEPIVEVPVVEEPVAEVQYIIYIVQPNDWLSRIAVEYNMNWEELQVLNEIRNADLIFPGQELRIPVQ